jgi:hypothetical protein
MSGLDTETFLKMDLYCFWTHSCDYQPSFKSGILRERKKKVSKIMYKYIRDKNIRYVVYVIENNNTYYIGLTSNLIQRLNQHLINNTNNILYGGSFYILENCETETQMRYMEMIWINWFKKNASCINIVVIKPTITENGIHKTTYKNLIYYGVIDDNLNI